LARERVPPNDVLLLFFFSPARAPRFLQLFRTIPFLPSQSAVALLVGNRGLASERKSISRPSHFPDLVLIRFYVRFSLMSGVRSFPPFTIEESPLFRTLEDPAFYPTALSRKTNAGFYNNRMAVFQPAPPPPPPSLVVFAFFLLLNPLLSCRMNVGEFNISLPPLCRSLVSQSPPSFFLFLFAPTFNANNNFHPETQLERTFRLSFSLLP